MVFDKNHENCKKIVIIYDDFVTHVRPRTLLEGLDKLDLRDRGMSSDTPDSVSRHVQFAGKIRDSKQPRLSHLKNHVAKPCDAILPFNLLLSAMHALMWVLHRQVPNSANMQEYISLVPT